MPPLVAEVGVEEPVPALVGEPTLAHEDVVEALTPEFEVADGLPAMLPAGLAVMTVLPML